MTHAYVDPERLESEWQARILGIVATLIDRSTLTWAEFRAACLGLRARNAAPDADDGPASNDEAWADLEDWAPALRHLLQTRGLLPRNQPSAETRHA
jgi:hypothetical protein